MSGRLPSIEACALLAAGLLSIGLRPAIATDLAVPAAPAVPEIVTDGIWGAIAFAPGTGRHGFFWGASTKPEAEAIALNHCANAGGQDCRVVSIFRNDRHGYIVDEAGQNAPRHCGALAVSQPAGPPAARWGSASASTRVDAETLALQRCGLPGACVIREWVCT